LVGDDGLAKGDADVEQEREQGGPGGVDGFHKYRCVFRCLS
jgi:hypothetical protein